MDVLIGIIAIIGIIYGQLKKQQKTEQKKKVVPNKSSSRTVPNRQNTRTVPNQSYRPAQNAEYYRNSQEAVRQELLNKQRELKERLAGKYGQVMNTAGAGMQTGRPVQNTYGRPAQRQKAQNAYGSTAQGHQVQNAYGGTMEQRTGDILSRANANVRENDVDQTELEMLAKERAEQTVADAHDLVNAIDIGAGSELMSQIDDLMIMGYQGSLSFERDFIAEGVEMLNSYELSDVI